MPSLVGCRRLLLTLATLTVLVANPAAGQAPLFLVDENTTVGEVAFEFMGTPTFEEELLKAQIAIEEPGFFNEVERVLPFLDAERYPFDPITLQKDVVRLRHFYENHGFLHAMIDYVPGSRLDTTSNTIYVRFTIEEGPPVIIQSVGFYGPEGARYAALLFEGALREAWIAFRDRTSLSIGERYSVIRRRLIEENVRIWLQNRGFAFAEVSTRVDIDPAANTADIRFIVDPGPRARIAEINVEGTQSVSPAIVRRELPFEVGDRFSQEALAKGQRELFDLNLFRLALVDLPPQPVDSTVTVSVRVREAELHYLSAETGYARSVGLTAEGSWTHRNFLGGARVFTASLTAESGVLAAPVQPLLDRRVFGASLLLRQPYLFVTNLSVAVSPFIQFEKNPLFEESNAFLQINAYEYGLSTTLIYEFLPFRTLSLRHTFSRASQLTARRPDVDDDPRDLLIDRDVYNKNVVTLTATFGRADNRLNPSAGFYIRPLVQAGGPSSLFGIEDISGVQFVKFGGEVAGYLPLADEISLAGRLSLGRIWPFAVSRNQFAPIIENRFDAYRYYGGGASDVRGWANQFLGPKFNRTEFARDSTGSIFFEGGLPVTTDERFEAVGGLAKVSGSLELRLPFPGLGDSWRTAVFLDFGQVSTRRVDDPACFPAFTCPQRALFEDEGDISPRPSAFKYAVGAGIRYRTPVGFIRLDLAYKLTPGPRDLRTPRNAFLVDNEEFLVREFPDRNLADKIGPEPHFLQRFNIHLSIGQAF